MNPWILVTAAALCLAAVESHPLPYPHPQAVEAEGGYPAYEAEPRAAMDHHKGGGHHHGKATSYQVSNNWAYHPVKVYVKHHGHHDAGADGGGHKDYVF